ncbi:carbohydrate ABC transporter permease [Thermanaerothrix sp. 4228-RoL]|uniref:Carbohydrate ABC transporter permease n=1 Tax=Thermanaerothrix solaris TaxID=3058434 RepID=A0ABU3NNQ2_9CHLR|nr:carbohydrate ABC transporter permease [Thermanaerothrix sp. 4228-RoL]MDT8898479.1 carbohydrate ABC transporter permease [Thermanaerothrix sp. 4228-RoL]
MNTSTVPFFQRASFNRKISLLVQYLILSILVIAILTPIVILVFGSLKTRGEMYSRPYIPPIPPYWENYIKILGTRIFWIMLLNSLYVSLSVTIGVLLICSLAAFAFARLNFRGKDWFFNYFTLGLMFPITVAILPVFLVIRQIGLTNTLTGIILVQTAFQLSGNIMILRNFFSSIPFELQDAAYIDGCNPFTFLLYILLPLARPALSAVAALTLVASWNDLLVPLVLVDKDTLWTLPLGTMQFQGQYGTDLSLVAAFVALSAIPAVVFYIFAERQIVTGLTAGALKG